MPLLTKAYAFSFQFRFSLSSLSSLSTSLLSLSSLSRISRLLRLSQILKILRFFLAFQNSHIFLSFSKLLDFSQLFKILRCFSGFTNSQIFLRFATFLDLQNSQICKLFNLCSRLQFEMFQTFFIHFFSCSTTVILLQQLLIMTKIAEVVTLFCGIGGKVGNHNGLKI